MGNSLWCSASGERLASAARDGDLVEARMLLDLNPCLASYSTFAALNSPLHFAASRGHSEIVMLLLENGADVNGRNFCGQTALMQACRYGHWEVVQALLIFRSNVMKAEYLSGKTALHFAAAHGHIRCIRLLLADFVPNAPFGSTINSSGGKETNSEGPDSSLVIKNDQCSALSRFVNKVADGGVTALHSAALNGHFDCVQLLLDLNAKVSAVTFHYGTSIKMIGAGSTPLHYAACGGNLKCCQILLAKGASRLSLNCNGWLPIDVARIWGHHYLQPLLAPNSDFKIPTFPQSSYLSLPLRSILNIARECKLQSSAAVSDDSDLCAVCLERACSVAAEGCSHELCVRCALYLCSTGNMTSEMGPAGSIPCPLCRAGIVCFIKSPRIPSKSLSLCASCTHHLHELDSPLMTCRFQDCKNRIEAVSSALI